MDNCKNGLHFTCKIFLLCNTILHSCITKTNMVIPFLHFLPRNTEGTSVAGNQYLFQHAKCKFVESLLSQQRVAYSLYACVLAQSDLSVCLNTMIGHITEHQEVIGIKPLQSRLAAQLQRTALLCLSHSKQILSATSK